MTVKAIYQNGIFRPTEPVNWPENSEVQVSLGLERPSQAETEEERRAREEVLEILSHRYHSGHSDTAERHNEHQP